MRGEKVILKPIAVVAKARPAIFSGVAHHMSPNRVQFNVAVAMQCVVFILGQAGFEAGGFASNGFGELSPGKYNLTAVVISEIVMTFMFLFIILGATDEKAPAGFAPIAIGLGLTLIHLISIPVSNTSVNPARSTAAALFADTAAMGQLWVSWAAPIAGAILAGVVWKLFFATSK